MSLTTSTVGYPNDS